MKAASRENDPDAPEQPVPEGPAGIAGKIPVRSGRLRAWAVPLALAVLTFLTWQFRFRSGSPDLVPPLTADLAGWTLTGGKPTLPPPTLGLTPGTTILKNLGPLKGARFLYVGVEARWQDIRTGRSTWSTGRVLIYGKPPGGGVIFPRDHAVFSAYGTRGWHREEAVFDLTEDLGSVEISLQHYGSAGLLEISDIECRIVHERPFYLPAMGALIVGWIAWLTVQIGGRLPSGAPWPRVRALGGAGVIAAAWITMVFPQPRFSARPLGDRFLIGRSAGTPAEVADSAPSPATSTPAPAPAPAPASAPAAATPPAVPAPAAPPPQSPAATPSPPGPGSAPRPAPEAPSPPPDPRRSHPLMTAIRALDERFNLIHVLGFAAFGLALFACTGLRNWPLAAVVAFASEALPNWQLEQPWDLGDLGDLAANAAGLLLAALGIHWIRKGSARWIRSLRNRFFKKGISAASAGDSADSGPGDSPH